MDFLNYLGTMGESPVPVIAAFFLGLMTAISPCPLATNITAIAYISKRIDNSRYTLLTGIVYTIGRMVAYVAVASVIVFFGMNLQIIALGLQHYGELLLGPFLVLCGIYLLDIFHFDRLPGGDWFSEFRSGTTARSAEKGYLGAFLLGVIFALSFARFPPCSSLPCSSRSPLERGIRWSFRQYLPLLPASGDCHLVSSCEGCGEVQRNCSENRSSGVLDPASGCGGFHNCRCVLYRNDLRR